MKEIKDYLTYRINELTKILNDKNSSEEESALAVGRLAIVSEMYSNTTEFTEKETFMSQMKIMLRHNINIADREHASVTGDTQKDFCSSHRFRLLNGKVLEVLELLVHFKVEHLHISSDYVRRFCSWRSMSI